MDERNNKGVGWKFTEIDMVKSMLQHKQTEKKLSDVKEEFGKKSQLGVQDPP